MLIIIQNQNNYITKIYELLSKLLYSFKRTVLFSRSLLFSIPPHLLNVITLVASLCIIVGVYSLITIIILIILILLLILIAISTISQVLEIILVSSLIIILILLLSTIHIAHISLILLLVGIRLCRLENLRRSLGNCSSTGDCFNFLYLKLLCWVFPVLLTVSLILFINVQN